MPGAGVTPQKLTIGELLHHRNPFEVPKYQRAYAWTEAELEDFEDDLTRLLSARHSGRTSTHFFGGLVSVLNGGRQNAAGFSYDVVDGQQRLTTFIIMLRLVVDELVNLTERARLEDDVVVERQADALADDMLRNYVQYTERMPDGQRVPRYRLSLSFADADFFVALLDNRVVAATRDSHQRLGFAHAYLKKKVIVDRIDQCSSLSERFKYLESLQEVLLEDAYVIHIVAEDPEEAYQLFAVLNDRGRMLADADLLRSLTLQMTEGDRVLQPLVATSWDVILAADMADADRFLRAYFPSFTGKRAPKVKMWHHFRDTWLSNATSGDVYDFVKDLENHAVVYRPLASGEWPFIRPRAGLWDRDRLKRLVISLKHDLAHPLLLAAAIGLNEPDFAKLVHLVERFAFRYKIIGGGHAGPASSEYYDAATAIRAGTFDIERLAAALGGLVARTAPDSVFRDSIVARLNYSSPAQRANIRYFLTTLDDYLGSLRNQAVPPHPDRTRLLDLAQVDVEHIYPQNPMFGDEDDDLQQKLDSIANLTFWAATDNRAAQNAPFAQKTQKYQQSASHLNRELASLSAWNGAAADARLARMLDDACRVWSIS